MPDTRATSRFPSIGDGTGFSHEPTFHREELQLANRNRGMPIEGLRYDITPIGMHYLLVHFDIPGVEANQWQLNVGGLVSRPIRLTLDEIKARPRVFLPVTMECAGNGRALMEPRPISQPWLLEAVGTAEWTGTSLRDLLNETGLSDKSVDVVFTGLDRGVQGEQVQSYQRSLTIDEATHEDVLLAYEMNGRPLEPQHGYPLRLIVPGWYGMTSVKWLSHIEVIGEAFHGYQMVSSYRYTKSLDEPGDPVTLIRVKSLMVPPGIPDFMTRTRIVEAGPVELTGRAWAGRRGITRVEISGDGGDSWSDAALGRAVSSRAWYGWRHEWDAQPGRYTLCVRATDSEGDTQPVAQNWSAHGVGNNMAQRVDVIVE